MTGAIILSLLGLCLLLSAILTAAQTAAFQVSKSRMRTLKSEGFKGAKALAEALEKNNTVTDVVLWGECSVMCVLCARDGVAVLQITTSEMRVQQR